MKRIYLIPAPDMDERAIEAVRIPECEIIRIKLPPLSIGTNLYDYIEGLKCQIRHEDPILLGFCYGGVLSIEIAKNFDIEKVVIVSGIKDNSDIVTSRKILAYAFFYLPETIQQFFGEGVALLVNRLMRLEIKIPRIWLKSSQNKFIIKHALTMTSQGVRCPVFRIHGRNDWVAPLRNFMGVTVIDDAGHFMFINRRKEVLQAIAKVL